ncbi:WD40 repeat-like protein [Cystobasidium minutum MCA 4210]|uniref:WD40 repeat-like protein n=1 Tax=Cystobasidium minutum MCA 4210 TaxID=1397322 RepID=UPI0034CFE0E6|eukprot:jgi/Rhomi1/211313/estExt_Genemark1.C_4_t20476
MPGTMDKPESKKRTAVLHLQPSVRQTVVKTITTTTIHYAPIPLPHPASPELTGDYAQDRHAHPLQLAEERRREALARGGRSREDILEDDPQGSSSASAASSLKDLRQFQLEFGKFTQNAKNKEPIKAIYTLDDDDNDAVPSTSKAGQASSTAHVEEAHAAPVDRKGKGRARRDEPAYVDEATHEGSHLETHLTELKRKRRASQERISNDSANLPESTSGGHAFLGTSSDSSNPPRKKTRINAAEAITSTSTHVPSTGLDTPDTESSTVDEALSLAHRSPKGKERAIPAEVVLPSPTLSPRLQPEDEVQERDENQSQAIDAEGRLVSYHGRAASSSSASARELFSTTRTEQIIEGGNDDSRSDEKQLECLSEGHTMSTLMSLPTLVSNYASLSEKLQLNILYQLLRQSSTPVIQRVNHIIQPALKRDFISDLPAELSLQVLSYLQSPEDIMRCLYVCKNWKRFIDSQGQIWSDLMKREDLWIGGRKIKRNTLLPQHCDLDDSEESQASSLGDKKETYGNIDIENEEADYWSSVGVTKTAFNRSRHSLARWGRRGTYKRRKSTSKSRSRERGDEAGEGETSRDDEKELDIKDLLSVSDWKSALFLKRWKERTWDEAFDMEEAARPTAEKLAALNDPSLQTTARASMPKHASLNHASASRLRRANTRPRIGESVVPHNATVSPPSAASTLPSQVDYVHPFKLIYKKRVAVRSHWFSREPADTSVHRITFRGQQTSVITSLQFDNEKIVTASDDPSIDIYDTMTGEMKMRLEGHDGGIWALQYVGNILVSGSTDRTVRVWDLETGMCTHVFYGHTSTVRCLQIVEPVNVNPDPNGPPVWEPPYPLIVTGSRDWTLRVWRLPYPTRTSSLLPYCPPSPGDEDSHNPANNAYHLRVLRGHGLAVRALAAHGRTVVSGSYDSYLRVWDLLSGECKHKLVGHGAKVYSVALDTARNRCASGSMDGSVRIWSLETGDCLFRLDGHSSLVGLLGCSYHFLVSAGADSTLKVWDPNTGTCIDTLAANAGAITCFKHDDFRIVSGCEGQLRVWDIRGSQGVKDVIQNMQGVWQLQFTDRFAVAAVSREGRTDFEILDFFPELREERPHWSEYDDMRDSYDSLEEDMHAFEDYGAAMDPGTMDEETSSNFPHYEVSSSQASMYQTPRQVNSSAARQPPARKHVDGRIFSYSDGQLKKHHHHHHHHQHHHHHGHTQTQQSGSTSRHTQSTLRPGRLTRSRNHSNHGSAMSSVIVEDPGNVDDLFAYDAGNYAGPSGSTYVQAGAEPTAIPGGYDANHLQVGATLAHLADSSVKYVKGETPEVKAEEDEDDENIYE